MSNSLSLAFLAQDVLITIMSYLGIGDVLHIRSTCRSLFEATQDKVLWIHLLKHLVDEMDVPLLPYGKALESLEYTDIEAVALRAAHLAVSWNCGLLKPQSIVRLDIGRSVTWLRLVCARSLFVASSDTVSSSLACWNIAAGFKGDKRPFAECFFQGPVRTAALEVQKDAVVIAVAIDSSIPVVEIIALRQSRKRSVFVRLAQLPGLSHIRLLSGDFVGCAMKDDMSIPHLVNWRSGQTYPLADSPDLGGGALAMFRWGEDLIVATPHGIELYMMPIDSEPPLNFQTLSFERFAWEIVIYDKSNISLLYEELFPAHPRSMGSDGALFILMFAEGGAYLYTLSVQTGTSSMPFRLCLVGQYDMTCGFREPVWGLNVGSTGHRLAYFKGNGIYYANRDVAPTFYSATIRQSASHATDATERLDALVVRALDIGNTDLLPCLWGLAMADFDEAVGLLAVGNVFGELAICDYVGLRMENLPHIAKKFPLQDAADLHIFPNKPIPLCIPPTIYFLPNDLKRTRSDEASVAKLCGSWTSVNAFKPGGFPNRRMSQRERFISKYNIDDWSNDWSKWKLWNSWQGLPHDRAWHLEHVHHIFGRPEPLLYHVKDEAFIFRAGGLYFLWRAGEDDEYLEVFDEPDVSLAQIVGLLCEDDWHSIQDVTPVGAQGEVAWEVMMQHYSRQFKWELNTVGRNRWIEQQERGGVPPSAYLVVPDTTKGFTRNLYSSPA